MEAIKEAYKEGTMFKAKVEDSFIHDGKKISIPKGWKIIKEGYIEKKDRVFTTRDQFNDFMSEEETSIKYPKKSGTDASANISMKICVIRKDETIKEIIKIKTIRMDKKEFLKMIKTFLGE